MPATRLLLPSPVGDLLLNAEDGALTGLYFAASERAPKADPAPPATGDDGEALRRAESDEPVLLEARRQLDGYWARERETFDLPLAPKGTPFQRSVWEALRAIPYGATTSYGEIARRLGNPNAVRAVGLANGQNPISIVLPCHRVLGADGKLIGYGGGIERKRLLLDHERGFL